MPKILAAFVALAIVAGSALWMQTGPGLPIGSTAAVAGSDLRTPMVNSGMHGAADAARAMDPSEIMVPRFSPDGASGEIAFAQSCAACHGANAAGTDRGPPLVHNLYRPGHHPDESVLRAVRMGVPAHHWRFGDMPPVPANVSDIDIALITQYMRELQRANGIQ